jgi:hypothetical protein
MGLLFKLLAPMRNVAAAAMPCTARIPGGCRRRCDCCSRQPRDNSGKQPVLAWLADQSPEVRASFAHLFELLESNGTAMGEPHVKPLGKSSTSCASTGRRFVMVHGAQKKTPKAELDKAIKRMADCLATDPTP